MKEPVNDAFLMNESTKVGMHYVKEKANPNDLFEQQIALNAAACGFYMGWKEAEKYFGIKEETK